MIFLELARGYNGLVADLNKQLNNSSGTNNKDVFEKLANVFNKNYEVFDQILAASKKAFNAGNYTDADKLLKSARALSDHNKELLEVMRQIMGQK